MARHDTPPEPAKPKRSISMHDDVPVWYDCCSCEAEPYWQEIMDEDEDKTRDEPEQGRNSAPHPPSSR